MLIKRHPRDFLCYAEITEIQFLWWLAEVKDKGLMWDSVVFLRIVVA